MNERFKLAGFTAVGMLILASVMTGLSASLLEIALEFNIAPSRAGILYSLHYSGFLGLILVSLAVNGLSARLRLVVFVAWLYAAALSSIACAGIWPLIVATSRETGHETGTTIIVAAGGLGAAVFPYLAGLISEFLPGRFILLMAVPLLLAVFLLSKSSQVRVS